MQARLHYTRALNTPRSISRNSAICGGESDFWTTFKVSIVLNPTSYIIHKFWVVILHAGKWKNCSLFCFIKRAVKASHLLQMHFVPHYTACAAYTREHFEHASYLQQESDFKNGWLLFLKLFYTGPSRTFIHMYVLLVNCFIHLVESRHNMHAWLNIR